MISPNMPEKIKDMMKIIKNALGLFANGISTFIPKKLATMVGIDKTIVIDAKNFMTIFRLLEMIEAKASIVPLRMLL